MGVIQISVVLLVIALFTLVPKLVQEEILAGWVNKSLQGLLKRQGDQVVPIMDPWFDESYFLLAEKQQPAAAFFDRLSLSC